MLPVKSNSKIGRRRRDSNPHDVWPCKPLSPAESNRRQLITHGKPAIHAVAVPCSTRSTQLNYFAINACLFHAVTRSAGIAASSFRRWAAFAVRLPCPQGPHGGLTAHGSRAAFTCTPHEKPHAADIRTRLGGTGEARSDATGFPIRKCSPCRAVSPFGGGEAFAYEHSPGRGVAGLSRHARSSTVVVRFNT